MEAYEYQPLTRPEDGHGYIRLVRIRSGAPEDTIRIWIQEFSLREVTMPGSPTWHALSYTWGATEQVEDIVVEVPHVAADGIPTSIDLKYLTVTRHLTEFLRELRKGRGDCIMWIDAICINQAEDPAALEERAWQVRMMHQVYSEATGVIVWLGPEGDDSAYAMQLLDELGSSFDLDWKTFMFSTSNGQHSGPMKKWANEYGKRATREFQAVWALLGRHYFTRTWVRQEAILANDQASVVRCGTQQVQLARFQRAIYCLGNFGFERVPVRAGEDSDERLGRALAICAHSYLTEPNLMAQT